MSDDLDTTKTPLFAPVEVVPAQIAQMANLIEKQARGYASALGMAGRCDFAGHGLASASGSASLLDARKIKASSAK